MVGTDLVIRDDQTTFDPNQVAALRQLGVEGASNADLAVFFHFARMTGLDPFLRQVYMIGRRVKEGERWVVKQTIQTGIDGFRLIASRGDQARSMAPVEWLRKDDMAWVGAWSMDWGYPVAARACVTRGNGAVFTAVANFDEYKQTVTGGGLNQMWRTKPALMIAKCAEALVLRMAYPQSLSGLYTDDEMPEPDEPVPGVVSDTQSIRPPSRVIEPRPALTAASGPKPLSEPSSLRDSRVRRTRAPAARPTVPAVAVESGAHTRGGIPHPSPPDEDVVDGEVVDEPLAQPTPPGAEMITAAQLAKLHVLLPKADLRDRDLAIQFYKDVTKDPVIESSKDLTKHQASQVIDMLEVAVQAMEQDGDPWTQ